MMTLQDKQALYKEIMGSYPTGVTVITTKDQNNQPVGLTVNSFASVSLEPLMVLWCIDKGSNSLEAFKTSNSFAVNILASDQKEICWLFASRNEQDRFSKTEWETSDGNLPILKGVFATLKCQKIQEIDAGDHIIMLGEVFQLQKNNTDPMLYYRRNVGALPDDWSE